MKHYLFSFAAVAFTAVALGSIAYYTRPQLTPEQIDHEEKLLLQEPTPSPKVEEVSPVVIELPDTPAPKPVVVRKPRPAPVALATKIEAAKIPDMVCENEWHDSVLFAGSAKYRNCKLK